MNEFIKSKCIKLWSFYEKNFQKKQYRNQGLFQKIILTAVNGVSWHSFWSCVGGLTVIFIRFLVRQTRNPELLMDLKNKNNILIHKFSLLFHCFYLERPNFVCPKSGYHLPNRPKIASGLLLNSATLLEMGFATGIALQSFGKFHKHSETISRKIKQSCGTHTKHKVRTAAQMTRINFHFLFLIK